MIDQKKYQQIQHSIGKKNWFQFLDQSEGQVVTWCQKQLREIHKKTFIFLLVVQSFELPSNIAVNVKVLY